MRLPVKLVYTEEQPDRKSAMKRERSIKNLKRAGKEKLILGKSTQVRRKARRQPGMEEVLSNKKLEVV
jgi:predicted GIY-YIG superfamily endonuclease